MKIQSNLIIGPTQVPADKAGRRKIPCSFKTFQLVRVFLFGDSKGTRSHARFCGINLAGIFPQKF